MKKNFLNKKSLLALAMVLLAVSNASAQSAGAAAIDNAAVEIGGYVDSVGTLIQVIGGVVGLIGGVRIYNKWTNGDNDVNKELIGWGGACVFLLLVPTVIAAFFNL